MSSNGHALVNLFTVSTVYWDQKENTAHLGKYSTVEHRASFEMYSQVYNMEIKVHFSLGYFHQSTIMFG